MFPEAKKHLENFLKPGDAVIVAVSGGSDSVALLDIVDRLRNKNRWHAVVAHVDHGIRGKESRRDADFVKRLCANRSLSVHVYEAHLKKAMPNLEEKARNIRRTFFESLKKRYSASCIVTAHHADDNIESIFLHFIRGSGPAGLAGMKIFDGVYLRPLLGSFKRDILDYCKKRKLSFCHDKTNNDIRHMRNFLRKEIIPRLRRRKEGLDLMVLRNSALFADISEHLAAEADHFLGPRAHHSVTTFRKFPTALQREVVQTLYRKTVSGGKNLSFVRVEEARALINKGHGKKSKPVGGEFEFWVEKGEFSLRKRSASCKSRPFNG